MEIKTIADIKLAGRAINGDWPVSQEMRTQLVERLLKIVELGDPDLTLAATKVFLAMDALNARKREAEQRRLEAEHARKLQLIELAVRLGVVDSDSGSTGISHNNATTR